MHKWNDCTCTVTQHPSFWGRFLLGRGVFSLSSIVVHLFHRDVRSPLVHQNACCTRDLLSHTITRHTLCPIFCCWNLWGTDKLRIYLCWKPTRWLNKMSIVGRQWDATTISNHLVGLARQEHELRGSSLWTFFRWTLSLNFPIFPASAHQHFTTIQLL